MTPAPSSRIPDSKNRTAAALGVALCAGFLCWFALSAHGPTIGKSGLGFYGGDFGWVYNAAGEFVQGLDIYRHPPADDYAPYPFPAVILAMPFRIVPPTIAAALFFGISSGLMAYGLLDRGWHGLLAFASCPYWIALQWAQWTPLVLAAAFFSFLAIVVCVKPQIALPVVLTHLNKIAIVSAFGLLAVSLMLFPTWPWKWLKSLSGYQAYFALVTLPGPLLLLAFKRWRDPDAKFLLLTSIFPQRWIYDGLILWLIPKTRKEYLYTALCSWAAFAWLLMRSNTDSIMERGAVFVLSFHIPMLIVILRRSKTTKEKYMKPSKDLETKQPDYPFCLSTWELDRVHQHLMKDWKQPLPLWLRFWLGLRSIVAKARQLIIRSGNEGTVR